MPTQIPSCSRKRRGYVLLTMAAGMFAILGFAGLVVDVGYLEYYKRKAQTAADAGEQGGVAEINQGRTNTVAQAAANDVTVNGFTDGANGASVVINNPPLTGGHIGNAKYVEVTVTQTLPTVFLQALSIGSMAVKARAVGALCPRSAFMCWIHWRRARSRSAGAPRLTILAASWSIPPILPP
jgi:uncharacterized membrane protein